MTRCEDEKKAGKKKAGNRMSEGLKCVECGKSVIENFKPFCSKRCSQIDLGRWFGGTYAIKAQKDED